jgi:membrane protease YdiL (CAAX protease family)
LEDQSPYERIPTYPPPEVFDADSPFERFKRQFGNEQFRISVFTWISLVTLIVFYPGISIWGAYAGGDPTEMLKNLTPGMLVVMLVATIVVQWAIFLLNYLSTYYEHTGLRGLGLTRIRFIDFAWAGAFLLAANLILTGVAWVLARFGLEMPGEIAFLIPQDPVGRVLWVAVSFTAGFCEEVAFRGYLMTRLRLLLGTKSWIVPTAISAVVFGSCHAYQGPAGFIVITVYGLMFSLLFIRTRTLWPLIIAHFFQDFMYLFFPGG